ncbi:MAG TPA: carbohydrate-binding family 9-like protein [Thermoanaerobaculia bacterium]|nr:carbohydrate-binding family 9-like protein [Thermoanaerobaculia bacterium]
MDASLPPPRLLLRRAPDGFRPAAPLAALPWQELPVSASLTRSEDGAAPEQATQVCACWDDEALYVRWECADRDAWGIFIERDAPLYQEEVVELFLAPGEADPRRYAEFEVAPTGVLFDALIANPEGKRAGIAADTAWDCPGLVWEAGKLAGDQNWWAALAVPWLSVLAALGHPPGEPPPLWRANFYRIERPRGGAPEYTAWSPTLATPPDFHRPARFGTLLLRG